jgi:hypothetical protein
MGPAAFATAGIAINQAFPAIPLPFHLLFHSVFHRCGNLGGETERDLKQPCMEHPTKTPANCNTPPFAGLSL